MKCQENVHGFEGNSIWISYGNFCQIWEEYMWSAIKVLNSGPKIWDSTKTHDTQLKLLDINWTLGEKSWGVDFSSAVDPLTLWFPKGVLKEQL